MYFGTMDAPGAYVCDLDTLQRLDKVFSVDTDLGEIVVADQPLRFCNGEIARRALKYQSVWAVFVNVDPNRINRPVAFHCHGRLS